MHVEDRHGLDELRREARSQTDARMRIRLQAIVLAKQGRTAEEIAEALDASRRPVQPCRVGTAHQRCTSGPHTRRAKALVHLTFVASSRGCITMILFGVGHCWTNQQ